MYGNQVNNLSPISPPPPQKIVRFDKKYLKTTSGLCQIVQLICNFLGFICLKVAWGAWISAIFYNLIFWIGNVITGILFVSYLFHIVEKYDHWPWHKYEFFYCGLMAAGYIVSSIFACTIGENVGYAVGFFGLCAILSYGGDAYLKYRAWKRGRPAQLQ